MHRSGGRARGLFPPVFRLPRGRRDHEVPNRLVHPGSSSLDERVELGALGRQRREGHGGSIEVPWKTRRAVEEAHGNLGSQPEDALKASGKAPLTLRPAVPEQAANPSRSEAAGTTWN